MRTIITLLVLQIPFTVVADSPGVIVDQARLERLRAATMPEFERPISFDSSEADAILSALAVFPPDNPWNIPVDTWPVADNSAEMIELIGADKPLRGTRIWRLFLCRPTRRRST